MACVRLLVTSVALAALASSSCRNERPRADASATSTSTSAPAAALALARARVPGIAYATLTREASTTDAAGLADVERKQAATGDMVFEAASIAKLVVATCVMQLVEDGSLDLDADVSKYVRFPVRNPRWPMPITVRMLLAHRAGVRDLDREIGARAEGNALGSFLKTYLVEREAPRAAAFFEERPGAAFAYSNVGASLAALAVERIASESFASFSKRRVLAPLRMTHTSWAAHAGDAVARPHAYRDGTFTALPPSSHALYPAVDLHSSASDLARFGRAILRDGELDGARILSASSVRTMLSGDGDQALGWQLRTIGDRRVAGHEGEDAGATTALFLDVAAGSGAVVLANGDAFSSGDRARADAVQALLAELLASPR